MSELCHSREKFGVFIEFPDSESFSDIARDEVTPRIFPFIDGDADFDMITDGTGYLLLDTLDEAMSIPATLEVFTQQEVPEADPDNLQAEIDYAEAFTLTVYDDKGEGATCY